jgi:2-keto-4-pentenoate hydratase
VDAEQAGGSLEAMVDAVAYRLSQAGEALGPGDRIITGVLCPPHAAKPADRVRLELEAVGAVELAFSE